MKDIFHLLFGCLLLAGSLDGVSSAAPTFSSVPQPVVALKETETQIQDLLTVTCTGDIPLVVSLDSTVPSSPCGTCFQVYPRCGGGTGYCLRYLPGQGTLKFSQVSNYVITLSCKDINSLSATTTVNVRIEPNTPPYPLQATKSYTLANAKNAAIGTSVTSASCNDDDTDALSYSMTSSPSTSVFTVGSADGIIRTSGNLAAECRSQFDLTVICTDNINSVVGTSRVWVTLSGGNDRPAISGINYSLNVREDKAVGSSLASFTVTDSDQTSCTLAANPTTSLQYFTLSTSNVITVGSALDYEQSLTRNTNLTVTCSDGYCTSYAGYLYVIVTDVNEPITLYPRDFTLSTYEGKISLDPGWTPIDPDENDYPTYTIVGGNSKSRFAINPTTGLITSTLDYDIDQGAMPSTDTIIVQVKDVAGHTSTTTVTLTILDLNDNAPIFNQQTQEITITDCTTSLGVIGTVTATDKDSSFQGNNIITYSGTNGPITIGSSGSIIANTGIVGGHSYTVSAVAKDAGLVPGPLSSTSAAITVIVTPCPTTTTSTTTTTTKAPTTTTSTTTTTATISLTNSKTSVTDNLGWIIMAALLGTVLLALAAFMVWRYCGHLAASSSSSGATRAVWSDCASAASRHPKFEKSSL
ncbi:uncharacterized protein LOC112562949 isoform X2 [Pomacea canaliculata]|nr:uncharacterized protein LOC112562949 isoform X2 [Pomacea canaliculata]